MAWHLNQALILLSASTRKKYSGVIIYSIGDAAHQNEVSDHNPNKYGRVNAIDVMLKKGVFEHSDAVRYIAWLPSDSRTKYVIYNRRIWTPAEGWHEYSGENPHTDHVHISVWDTAYTDTRQWKLEKESIVAVQDDVWNYNVHTTGASLTAKGALTQIDNRTNYLANTFAPAVLAALAGLATDNDAVLASLAHAQASLDELTADPVENGFGNPIVAAAEYAENNEPA